MGNGSSQFPTSIMGGREQGNPKIQRTVDRTEVIRPHCVVILMSQKSLWVVKQVAVQCSRV